MATIEFFSGIADKPRHTLRLLRKAHAKGARVAVVGDVAELRRLDAELWTADAGDFVPHLRVEGQAPPVHMHRTPLWLVEDARQARRCSVLVNLGPDAVEAPDGFERVIEIVSTDPNERKAARVRWRRYESMGHTIQHTPLGAEKPNTPDGDPPAEA